MKHITLLASMLSILLSGCGFHIRGSTSNSSIENASLHFKYWQITNPISKDLYKPLANNFKLYNSELTPSTSNLNSLSQVNLDIKETYEEKINSINIKGQVSEVKLIYKVEFIARNSQKDQVLLTPTTIEQYKNITMNESATLAKEQEKYKNLQDMKYNAAQRMFDYIEKIKP